MKFLQSFKMSFFLCLLLASQGYAQDWDNYSPTKQGGRIPNEFLKTSTEKYLEKKEKMAVSKKKKRRMSEKRKENLRLKEQFHLESIFKIDDLLLSGRVLFNEPLSDYVAKVGHELIKDNKRLVEKLKFYVVKSPVPNAFATDQGIVFVNIGLLARLENEAQLAFILSHEISHYTQHHVLKGYIHSKKLQKKASSEYGSYQRKASYDMLLAKSSYSRGHEMRADKVGYALFAKSKYKLSEALGVFDILEASQEPYAAFDLDISLLETSFLSSAQPFLKPEEADKVTDDIITLEIRMYGEDELTEADRKNRKKKLAKLKTHPDPKRRKEAVQQLLGTTAEAKGELFVVSKSEFENIKKRSQFELCYLFLEKRAYYDAFYQCLLLQEKYPNSKYLKLSMAKALYGMAKYQNARSSFVHFLQYDSISTTSSALHQTVATMHPRKLNILTLSYMYELQKQYTDSRYLKVATEDILFDLIQYHLKEEYALDALPTERFKAAAKVGELLMKDDGFKTLYQQEKERYAEQLRMREYYQTKKGEKDLKKFKKRMRKGKIGAGIDKVVVFSPFIHVLDFHDKYLQNHDNPVGYVEAEKNKQTFGKNLKTAGKSLGMSVEVLDAKSLNSPSQTARFNDIAILNAWFAEKLNHSDVQFFIPSSYEEIMQLGDKYGTYNFAHIGVLTMIRPFNLKRTLIQIVGYSAPAFILADNKEAVGIFVGALYVPSILYAILGSKYYNAVYSLAYNAEENRPISVTFHRKRHKLNDAFTTKVSQKQLNVLKKKPRKK